MPTVHGLLHGPVVRPSVDDFADDRRVDGRRPAEHASGASGPERAQWSKSLKQFPMAPQLSVVIVGGGLGGLFAANALIAQGVHVSVYEQASALGEVGAGVFVTPNAVRHLERVGLGPAVERRGARVGTDSRYLR